MDIKPSSPLHLIGHFDGDFAGAERELIDLARLVAPRRPAWLWSDVEPGAALAAQGMRAIGGREGLFPRGGTLLIGGVHVSLGSWLERAAPARIVLRYNLPNHARLFHAIETLRAATGLEPELRFSSKALQDAVGLAGEVECSLIDLGPFEQASHRPHEGFVVGRLSRDVPEKHHPLDPALYRALAARGVQVRVMGGTCLAPALAEVPGIELLPAGAMPAPEFLAGLDAMFYRTGSFHEPYGRVIFEALATGLPLVAAARGGYVEFLEAGEEAILVHSQDDAFEALLRLRSDVALRERLIARGRKKAGALHGAPAIESMVNDYLR